MGKLTGKRKVEHAQRCKYSEEAMRMAINDVKLVKLSARAAALKYDVPRATLGESLKLNAPYVRQIGCPPSLNKDEENKIVECVLNLANAGFPLTRNQLIENVST